MNDGLPCIDLLETYLRNTVPGAQANIEGHTPFE